MSKVKPEAAEGAPPLFPDTPNTITRPVQGSLLGIMRFAQTVATSMQDFYEAMESARVEDFEAMSQDIANIRGEVARLRADDLAENALPAIGETLDSLRDSISTSAEAILLHAEGVINARRDDPECYAADVNTHMVHIIEACAFQDLAGQRLDRVADLLRDVTSRLERFALAIGAEDSDAPLPMTTEARERRRARLLLHGPQSGNVSARQAEIDRLFDE